MFQFWGQSVPALSPLYSLCAYAYVSGTLSSGHRVCQGAVWYDTTQTHQDRGSSAANVNENKNPSAFILPAKGRVAENLAFLLRCRIYVITTGKASYWGKASSKGSSLFPLGEMVAESARMQLFFPPEVIWENQSDNFGYFGWEKSSFAIYE